VRIGARRDLSTVGGDDLDRQERIDRQAVLADEPADAATEREPTDPDRRGIAERRAQAVRRRSPGVFAGRQAGPGPGGPRHGIDEEALHRAEVQDDAAVVGREPGEAVGASANGERPSWTWTSVHVGCLETHGAWT